MKNPKLPPILYKYWTPSISSTDKRIPFIDCDSLVRFTQPNSFNDPFESLPIWTLEGSDADTLEKFIADHCAGDTPLSDALTYDKRRRFKAFKRGFAKKMIRNEPEKLLEMLSKNANGVASAASGILSLSATWQASPMWAHYAANHEGVCIGFDTSNHFFRHRKDTLIYKVEYRSERPVVPICTVFESGLVDALYETKDDRWRYEEEFRLVKPLKAAVRKASENDKRGFAIHLFRIPSECMKDITVGLHSTSELRESIKTWQAKNPHVEIYEAMVGKKGYSMERRPLI